MQSQIDNGKKIRQMMLKGKKQYFPNKFYSAYEFLEKINTAIQVRYDMKIIEVKYFVTKSRKIKELDNQFNPQSFDIDPTFNNVFSINDPFLKQIFKDVEQLKPLQDYDYNKLQQENQMIRKKEEQKKLQQIEEAMNLLKSIQFQKYDKNIPPEIRTIQRFKCQLKNDIKDAEIDVFIKGIITDPVLQRIQKQKQSKNPIVVQSQAKQQIRVYLYPTKTDAQPLFFFAQLYSIKDWSICSLFPQKQGSPINGTTLWGVEDINNKAQIINKSVLCQTYLSLHKNRKGTTQSFQYYAFLFNQIVIKAKVTIAQIKLIQHYKTQTQSQYYFYLSYPPQFHIALLKPQIGCDNGYIRQWQRLDNFTLMRNADILKDQFVRLYLFNNTILKVVVQNKQNNIKNAKQLIEKIVKNYQGNIKYRIKQKNWDLTKKYKHLNTIFHYEIFKTKLTDSLVKGIDKQMIWKVKYLIMVIVRYNMINPLQVSPIIQFISQTKQFLNIHFYILWQKVSYLQAITDVEVYQNFPKLYIQEFQKIKKLNIDDIIKKVGTSTDMITYVFRGNLSPSGYLYNPPTPQMKGRLMKHFTNYSQHFFRVTITDQSQNTLKNQKYLTKRPMKYYLQQFQLLGRKYIPLGWSPSQLRSFSLWFIHQIKKDNDLSRQKVLCFLGDFSKITVPAKKAARIGQSFSASWTYNLQKFKINQKIIEDDRSSQGFLYTDGIGKISENLIQNISLKLKIRDLSIIQIRYKGAKGLFVLDKQLESDTLVMRKSMIKYECIHDSAKNYLDILDWNKYKAGFLNRQTIILLKTLGISDLVFKNLHNRHIQRISSMTFKDCSIFKHMNDDLSTDINNLQPANITILHLLKAGFKLQTEPFFRGILQTMKKNGYHQLKVKSNILIQKSARIIGIIDQFDILQQGQLYCTIFDSISLTPIRQNIVGDVIITRNPCLHPADIRKLKCISQEQIKQRFYKRNKQHNKLQPYINCVIFPKKGQIPVTSQISGSDLDGDNFFICWAPQLIPEKHEPIYTIDNPINNKNVQHKTKEQKQNISTEQSYKQMLNFFVDYLNYQKLGQIDNSHLVHADQSQHFAKDKKCIQLALIHGKAVDFPKSGYCPNVDPKLLVSSYPDFMQKQQAHQYTSMSILGHLYRDVKQKISVLYKQSQTANSGKIDEDVIKQLTQHQSKILSPDPETIKQIITILLKYQQQLNGLISLVGVDSQYQIYSGNFTIAKDKVKSFGKNRLISTILAMRSRYFQQFFTIAPQSDKQTYMNCGQQELSKNNLFQKQTITTGLLFYLCSYIMKFHSDSSFLNDDKYHKLRQMVIQCYKSKTYSQEGKFCGFVWFIIPKILINQKYISQKKQHQQKIEEGKINQNKLQDSSEQDQQI